MAGFTSTISTGSSGTGLDITSGQTLLVQAGGIASSTIIETGGSATILGTDIGATISAGGAEAVSGTTSGDLVFGTQTVLLSGAAVVNDTVYAGGALNLFTAGAIASNAVVSGGAIVISGRGETLGTTTVTGGGQILLESAKATLSGSITFSGAGSIVVSSIASPISGGSSFGDQAPINGFGTGDLIDLTVISGGSATFASQVGPATLAVNVSGMSNGTAVTERLLFNGVTSANFGSAVDSGGGFELTYVACYAEGTRILTDAGEIAIERLAIGDRVVTADGRLQPVRWIGRRSYSGRALLGRAHLLPVRIKAGALAEATPTRDLLVSPLHGMLIDGVLVPAHALLNGTTIVQEVAVEAVHYLHLELDRHEAVLAEGAASETFVDDDSRFVFQTGEGVPVSRPGRAAYCAPRVDQGARLDAIRRRIAARAALPV